MEKLKIVFVSLLIGIVDAIIFVVFEFIVTQGTDYLWNDFFNTDSNRVATIPVAIFLSIVFSAIILLFKQKRVGRVETNLLEDGNIKPTTINDLIAIFIIGSASLLAGASLGPEASLVGITSGLGIWFAQRSKKMEAAKLFALSSVGALLVAFFGSLFPILIPILILYKKEKKLVPEYILPPIITGVAAYITLVLINGEASGYGGIPTGESFLFQDLIGAFILGIFGAIVAYLIKKLITRFEVIAKNIDSKTHWVVSSAIFGAVLGVLYLIGGPTIEFSGKEGAILLLQNNSYSIITLIVIVVAKLLVTSWSLPSGYRGGLVFPSIFIAVTLSLILSKIDPVLGGSGITIGATAGMMTAMLPPVMGFILVLSMIPLNFILVAIAGLIGAIIGNKITTVYLLKSKKTPRGV